MHYIKLYFIFPFPGISKMYTDIIRGESMIICGFTSIFFGVFRNNILSISNFRGKSIIFSVYFLKSFLYGTFQFILKLKYIQDVLTLLLSLYFTHGPIKIVYQVTRK